MDADDDGVGGLQGEVGTGPVHGNADIGGEPGGVIDTVTNEQGPAAGVLQARTAVWLCQPDLAPK